MERKLVKQGRNALTITLPAAWIKEKGLGVGDVVDVQEHNNELLIRTPTQQKRREIEINAHNMDSSMILHSTLGAYIQGYDRITLINTTKHAIRHFKKEFIGMVLEEHTATKLVWGSVISIPQNTLESLIRRILHQLASMTEELERITQNKSSPADIKTQEQLLDSTIYFCQRYLNKYENRQHAYQYFLLLSTIEAAGDQLSHIAKFIENDKALGTLIHKNTQTYASAVANKDLPKLSRILKQFRDGIRTKTFAQGIAYAYAETLYNNIGYLFGKD